ncbi:MAG: hypothetical protein R2712_18950 [Vicinamibacterales bacterium]
MSSPIVLPSTERKPAPESATTAARTPAACAAAGVSSATTTIVTRCTTHSAMPCTADSARKKGSGGTDHRTAA